MHTNTEVSNSGTPGEQQDRFGKPLWLGPVHLPSPWLGRSGVGLDNLHFFSNTGAKEVGDDTSKSSSLS